MFVPPGTEDPSDFVSFDYHSSEIYGFAYRALKRRMAVVGVDVPAAGGADAGADRQDSGASLTQIYTRRR